MRAPVTSLELHLESERQELLEEIVWLDAYSQVLRQQLERWMGYHVNAMHRVNELRDELAEERARKRTNFTEHLIDEGALRPELGRQP